MSDLHELILRAQHAHARCSSLSTTSAALLATIASILIDDMDGAVFASRTEVPVF